MSSAKIAVSLDEKLLTSLDDLVSSKVFASRSQAVQIAVQEKLARLKRTRLARECAKLDPVEEKQLAEEGLAGDMETWPEY